jgi:hypothetical protein
MRSGVEGAARRFSVAHTLQLLRPAHQIRVDSASLALSVARGAPTAQPCPPGLVAEGGALCVKCPRSAGVVDAFSTKARALRAARSLAKPCVSGSPTLRRSLCCRARWSAYAGCCGWTTAHCAHCGGRRHEIHRHSHAAPTAAMDESSGCVMTDTPHDVSLARDATSTPTGRVPVPRSDASVPRGNVWRTRYAYAARCTSASKPHNVECSVMADGLSMRVCSRRPRPAFSPGGEQLTPAVAGRRKLGRQHHATPANCALQLGASAHEVCIHSRVSLGRHVPGPPMPEAASALHGRYMACDRPARSPPAGASSSSSRHRLSSFWNSSSIFCAQSCVYQPAPTAAARAQKITRPQSFRRRAAVPRRSPRRCHPGRHRPAQTAAEGRRTTVAQGPQLSGGPSGGAACARAHLVHRRLCSRRGGSSSGGGSPCRSRRCAR